MCKIVAFLCRHESVLRKDPEFTDIMCGIGNIASKKLDDGVEQEESAELRVEEGIQLNKVNLFQFGSPRGMTQMQYFKAALQL